MDQNAEQTGQQILALQQELARLNRHRYIRLHNSLPKLIGFNFIRGLAFGFGTVVGATILVWIISMWDVPVQHRLYPDHR